MAVGMASDRLALYSAYLTLVCPVLCRVRLVYHTFERCEKIKFLAQWQVLNIISAYLFRRYRIWARVVVILRRYRDIINQRSCPPAQSVVYNIVPLFI